MSYVMWHYQTYCGLQKPDRDTKMLVKTHYGISKSVVCYELLTLNVR